MEGPVGTRAAAWTMGGEIGIGPALTKQADGDAVC